MHVCDIQNAVYITLFITKSENQMSLQENVASQAMGSARGVHVLISPNHPSLIQDVINNTGCNQVSVYSSRSFLDQFLLPVATQLCVCNDHLQRSKGFILQGCYSVSLTTCKICLSWTLNKAPSVQQTGVFSSWLHTQARIWMFHSVQVTSHMIMTNISIFTLQKQAKYHV
jgi:hypothetical protein